MRISDPDRPVQKEVVYRHRFLSVVIVVELLFIVAVRFWPVEQLQIREYQPPSFDDQVLIDDIEITRHHSSPPPPPRPAVPQPVPDDQIIEEIIEFEQTLNLVDIPAIPEERGSGIDGDEDMIVSEPQLPPSVVYIVEPSVPQLPSELRGRIEMVVNFLVNRDGSVEEASIVQIRKYDEERREYEVLPFIEYGLMGATLEAALNWRFRAARHEGMGVRTYTTATFNY